MVCPLTVLRQRKALENRTNTEEDRVAILEAQLAQAKLIAEEADKKYEEVGWERVSKVTPSSLYPDSPLHTACTVGTSCVTCSPVSTPLLILPPPVIFLGLPFPVQLPVPTIPPPPPPPL